MAAGEVVEVDLKAVAYQGLETVSNITEAGQVIGR